MFSRAAHILRAWAEKDGRGYPDWATRYLPVVRSLRPELERGPILEIGANANGFSRFSGKAVVAVDIAPGHLAEARATQRVRPAAGDMTRLPFADGRFAVIVCMDSFEHIPEASRARAAREIVRCLAPGGVAVAGFPAGHGALAAEKRVSQAYQHFAGRKLHWLEEHSEMGLPDPAAVADAFREAGPPLDVHTEKNTNLRCWEAMWRIMLCGWPGRGNALFQVLLRLAVPVLSRCHWGVCYRALVWVRRAH